MYDFIPKNKKYVAVEFHIFTKDSSGVYQSSVTRDFYVNIARDKVNMTYDYEIQDYGRVKWNSSKNIRDLTLSDVAEGNSDGGSLCPVIPYASSLICRIFTSPKFGADISSVTLSSPDLAEDIVGELESYSSQTNLYTYYLTIPESKVMIKTLGLNITDSRGFVTSTPFNYIKAIDYFAPSAGIDVATQLDGDTAKANITITGKFSNIDLSYLRDQNKFPYSVVPAIPNRIEKYVLFCAEPDENSGLIIKETKEVVIDPEDFDASDNSYELTDFFDGLDNQKTYVFYATVCDSVTTAGTPAVSKKFIPSFDWSNEDFTFHIPVNMDSPLAVASGGTGSKTRRTSVSVSSTTVSNFSTTIYYYPYLSMCFVRMYFTPTNKLAGNTSLDITTVPAEYKPSTQHALSVFTNFTAPVSARITAEGVIQLKNNSPSADLTTGYAVYVTGFWFV